MLLVAVFGAGSAVVGALVGGWRSSCTRHAVFLSILKRIRCAQRDVALVGLVLAGVIHRQPLFGPHVACCNRCALAVAISLRIARGATSCLWIARV